MGKGCRAPDQMSEFYTAGHNEGREGQEVGGERSCLPVTILNREYQKYFDFHGSVY